MLLGLGYGELMLVIGAGAVLLGPKDLVKISGSCGRVVGWTVGYLRMARGQLQDIGAASEMARMHHEMQVTVQQLHKIREEIRQGAKILNPTHSSVSPGQGHWYQNDPTVSAEHMSVETPSENHIQRMKSFDLPKVGFAAQAIQQETGEMQGGDGMGADVNFGTVVPIPVSAVSAGMIEPRESGCSGSDILLDALLEEEVAHKAKLFFTPGKEKSNTASE